MGVFPHILKKSKKIATTDSQLYFYRYPPENASHAAHKIPVGAMDRALVFIERYSMASD